MGLALLFGLFFFGLIVGVPVAFALGIAAVATFVYEGFPLFVAFQRILSGISVYSLLAIPFFIFAGELMLHGGIATRLVRLAAAAVGRLRGGLGVVNVTASMLFGGISGSAVADTSALGAILMPVMKEKGYDADYAVNVTVTSSVAGVVIPPSHNMILYAVAAGGSISVGKLFIAGIIPGILMCVCLGVAAYLVAVRRGYGSEPFPGWRAFLVSFVVAVPGLLTAIIIVGGVLSGILTVTESGAFGAIYAVVVTTLVYRELTWDGFHSRRCRRRAHDRARNDPGRLRFRLRLYARALPRAGSSLVVADRYFVRSPRDPAHAQRHPARAGHDHGHGSAHPDLHADLPAGGH